MENNGAAWVLNRVNEKAGLYDSMVLYKILNFMTLENVNLPNSTRNELLTYLGFELTHCNVLAHGAGPFYPNSQNVAENYFVTGHYDEYEEIKTLGLVQPFNLAVAVVLNGTLEAYQTYGGPKLFKAFTSDYIIRYYPRSIELHALGLIPASQYQFCASDTKYIRTEYVYYRYIEPIFRFLRTHPIVLDWTLIGVWLSWHDSIDAFFCCFLCSCFLFKMERDVHLISLFFWLLYKGIQSATAALLCGPCVSAIISIWLWPFLFKKNQ